MASQMSLSSSPAPESSVSQQARRESIISSVATQGELATKRTSSIWDHSYYPRTEIHRNTKGQSIWRCAYCTQEYVDTGTKNQRNHLNTNHGSKLRTYHQERIREYQGRIDLAQWRVDAQEVSHKRRKLDNSTEEEATKENSRAGRDIDPDMLENLYVQWVTACGISFEMVTREEFRA
jgi:BED zinc finger